MSPDEKRQFGRAKNAVLTFFENKLFVPKVYFDAVWDGQTVDVLAIDRGGGGDVHAVSLVVTYLPRDMHGLEDAQIQALIDDVSSALIPVIDRLLPLSAQYKYIGAVNVGATPDDPLPGIPPEVVERSYDGNGIGRIGFLSIDPSGIEEPRTTLVLKPERFRAKVADLVGDYLEHHAADWEIRA